MKKILSVLLSACLVASLCACGAQNTASTETSAEASVESSVEASVEAPATEPAADPSAAIKVGMVTDVGGINDQSFNQSAWAGLSALAAENAAVSVNYLESKTDADYANNIQT
ncbi:MAG: BMP family ABC transporter substrate-binding protein, partial [Lachnospiraceae bacterium]|nr:BMP family ABC transporter substrate-binding protein [Lachnospiraceae bacterium]